MATIPQELTTILQTLVKPNYSNANVDNYYDPTTMLPKAPTTNPDRGMQAITETILYERNQASYGYNIPLTTSPNGGTKKELYQDISDDLGAAITALTAVKTAIDTVLGGL